jgi:hypothetical protein
MPAPAEVPVATEELTANDVSQTPDPSKRKPAPVAHKTVEIGGPTGPEPTRYGDWEKGGRCIDL